MTPIDIKLIRMGLGLTQKGLANALRLKKSSGMKVIRDWEKGKRPISGPASVALLYMEKYGLLTKEGE